MNFEKFKEGDLSIEKAIEQGWHYLESEHNNGHFPSCISTSREMALQQRISPRECFSAIVIADTTLINQPKNTTTQATLRYIENNIQQSQFTFFEDRTTYPPDTDTNALGYSVLLESGRPLHKDAHYILDTILAHQNENGLVQVWLSKDRQNRIDPVVGANALYLAHLLGRGAEMSRTESWLMEVINSGTYMAGSRYYQSPDSFLHFMGRLLKFPELSAKIQTKLAEHLKQRIGKTAYPLDLAMRTALAGYLGIQNEEEKQQLLKIQGQDGSWPNDAFFHYGSQQGYFGSKALTTAFSIKGLA